MMSTTCDSVDRSKCSVGGALGTDSTIDLTITDTIFRNNQADLGGALYLNGVDKTYKSHVVQRNTFESNLAHLCGGALLTFGDGSNSVIKDLTFRRNTGVV